MSVLSSTGLGAVRARMNRYYAKREEFYKEIEENNIRWIFRDVSDVYSDEELTFIREYIKKYGWHDQVFVNRISKVIPDFRNITTKTAGAGAICSELVQEKPMSQPVADLMWMDI